MPPKGSSRVLRSQKEVVAEKSKRPVRPSTRTLDHFSSDQQPVARKGQNKRPRAPTLTDNASNDEPPLQDTRRKNKQLMQEELDKSAPDPGPVTPLKPAMKKAKQAPNAGEETAIVIRSSPVERLSYIKNPTTSLDKSPWWMSFILIPILNATKRLPAVTLQYDINDDLRLIWLDLSAQVYDEALTSFSAQRKLRDHELPILRYWKWAKSNAKDAPIIFVKNQKDGRKRRLCARSGGDDE